jgi:hypothetical protein
MRSQDHSLTSLRVAVTGHRDLDLGGHDDARRIVRGVIDDLVNRCAPARVELLTGMADGADQIVTEVAIQCDCDIHVVLPKPYDEYRSELSLEGAASLDKLSARAGTRVSIVADGNELSEPATDPALAYHRLGVYLARTAHVLIALWDGEMERKPGGTLDVLASFLEQRFDTEPSDSVPDPIQTSDEACDHVGPTAVWVRGPRTGSDTSDVSAVQPAAYIGPSGIAGVWYSSPVIPSALANMLDDLSQTKLESTKADVNLPAYPLLEHVPDDLDPSRRDASENIHAAYLAADRLAMLNQTRSDSAFIGATLIAAGMGFAFLWFAKIDDHLGWLYAYLVLFGVGYALFRVARARHWLHNHLSFRVLAETLRVRYFMTLLGLDERVDVRRVMAQTGVSSFPGFAWAREADRIGVPLAQGLPEAVESQGELVNLHWVDDQAAYFGRKVDQLKTRHERLELVQRVLYVLSFLAVLVIITYGADLKSVYAPGHVSLKTVLIFLMGLLPLWLTLWELHQGRMATRELLWQFRNQATIFARASTELQRLGHDDAKAHVYIDLAERSLFETYLWTLHRFHREFSPPSGG